MSETKPDAPRLIVAIPARDERERLRSCLAALAGQRDFTGAPLGAAFEVVVLVNNSVDETAAQARALKDAVPFPLFVTEVDLPGNLAHAGGARRGAMDLAAERLATSAGGDGIILTTDADSRVSPTWIAAQVRAFAEGADAVAGYVDADPDDYLALGPAFGQRGRNEDRYLRAVAEIHALCDPRPHDPWPNHRVASGASLAVTLTAYRASGGMPPLPLGEDAAFVHALECSGFRVRHSVEAFVTTSCRFDSRVKGGAGDTMRIRHADPDAPCDDAIVPALDVLRRAALKGRMRCRHASGSLANVRSWAPRLRLSPQRASALCQRHAERPFALFWGALAGESPALAARPPLRPRDLPRETAMAERIARSLRRRLALNVPVLQGERPAPAAESAPASG